MRVLVLSLVALLVSGAAAGCLSSGEGEDSGSEPVTPAGGREPMAGSSGEVTWGSKEEAAIRPGASLGGYCTFNWLFTDTDGNAYIGTAGHCTEKLQERVALGDGTEIGTVVYDSDVTEGADAAVDFSLVLLDAEQVANAHPAMLGWEGPSGAVTVEDLAVADEVALHGYGIVLGQNPVTRDRSGVLVDWDEKLYRADMPAVNGDSGSPLLHLPTGKALGIISHYGTFAMPPSTDEGPLMPFIFVELEKAGFNVELATV